MIAKILVSIGLIVIAVVLPLLEVNASHVFNPDWPPHARLHEVWQLTTNFFIGVLCLWLVWVRQAIQIPAILVIIVMGSVLLAHVIEDFYGGSILSGNTSKTLFGVEIAVFTAILVVVMAIAALMLNRRASHRQ